MAAPQTDLFTRHRIDLPHLMVCDAVEWLRKFPPESVDLVITDPAYESLEEHRSKGTTTRLKQSKASSNEWFEIFRNDRFPDLFTELYRVLKPNTHLYIFCDRDTMWVIRPMGEEAGFKFWKDIIWSKRTSEGKPYGGMGYHYRASCERILFFEKGKRKLNDLGIPDVLDAKPIRGKEAYPTEKPVSLSETLVLQSSDPGEVVIDPFVGSGSTFIAAFKNLRKAMGCDIKQAAVDLAKARWDQSW